MNSQALERPQPTGPRIGDALFEPADRARRCCRPARCRASYAVFENGGRVPSRATRPACSSYCRRRRISRPARGSGTSRDRRRAIEDSGRCCVVAPSSTERRMKRSRHTPQSSPRAVANHQHLRPSFAASRSTMYFSSARFRGSARNPPPPIAMMLRHRPGRTPRASRAVDPPAPAAGPR